MWAVSPVRTLRRPRTPLRPRAASAPGRRPRGHSRHAVRTRLAAPPAGEHGPAADHGWDCWSQEAPPTSCASSVAIALLSGNRAVAARPGSCAYWRERPRIRHLRLPDRARDLGAKRTVGPSWPSWWFLTYGTMVFGVLPTGRPRLLGRPPVWLDRRRGRRSRRVLPSTGDARERRRSPRPVSE